MWKSQKYKNTGRNNYPLKHTLTHLDLDKEMPRKLYVTSDLQ